MLVACGALFLLAIWTRPASAATRTWTGNAPGDPLWTNPLNWSGGQVPQPGDDLVFPIATGQLFSVNNYAPGTTFNSLFLDNSYTIVGNRLIITESIHLENSVPATATVACDVELTGQVVTLSANPTATLVISGVLSGSAPVTIDGDGVVRFAGNAANTYTGRTHNPRSTLILAKPASVVAVPAGLTVGDDNEPAVVRLLSPEQIQGDVLVEEGALLDLEGQNESIGALTMRSGAIDTDGGILTLGGDVTVSMSVATSTIHGALSLGGQTRTFHMEGGTVGIVPQLRISAAIIDGGGPAGVVKTGSRTLALAGPNSYTGATILNQGEVWAEHPQAFGSPSGGTTVLPQAAIGLQADVPSEPLTGIDSHASGRFMLACNGNPATRVWGGSIVLNGENAVLTGDTCTLRLTGVISGSGSFESNGIGWLELGANNLYTGRTTLVSNVRLLASEVLPHDNTVTIHRTLALNGFFESLSSITAFTPTAEIAMDGGTFQIVTPTDSTYSGRITGMGNLAKLGSASWTLSGTSTFTGVAAVTTGRLVVTGTLPAAVTLQGGTFQGTGTVGTIAGTAGTIHPGHPIGTPGIVNGATTLMNPTITLAVALNGPTPGTQHSQLRVTGNVVLNGAVLNIAAASGGTAIGTTPLVIVDNDGTDAVNGTFENLAEGATFTSEGVLWRVSYVGGTGNDVTLTVASASYYLSEGATGPFFDTDLLIANPNTEAVSAELRFLKEDGTTVPMTLAIAALSRTTIRVDDIAGLEGTAFSTVVTSPNGLPLLVERTMSWDASGYGSHTEKASGGPALTWYFAEGSAGYFHTYLLLSNAQDVENEVTVTFLPENQPAVTRTYQLLPHARRTVDTSEDADLLNRSFGMAVAFALPGMAERAMYFGDAPLFSGGHASAGMTAPATSWFLAEGATGPYFETFILLANPGAQPVDATVTYLPDTGVPVVKQHTIGAGERLTLDVELEDTSLANVSVATTVTAPTPIVVERSQYWPYTPDQWLESHNSAGVTELGLKWGLAEGRVGGAASYQSYILLANPGQTAANVEIQFLRESGAPVVKSFTVAPTSRVNVSVGPGTDVPELTNESFGTVITSTQPIAVERAMYADTNGQTWAAGTNATATRLP